MGSSSSVVIIAQQQSSLQGKKQERQGSAVRFIHVSMPGNRRSAGRAQINVDSLVLPSQRPAPIIAEVRRLLPPG